MKIQKQYFSEPGEEGAAALEAVVEQTPEQLAAAEQVQTTEDLKPIDFAAAADIFKEEGIEGEEKSAVAESAKVIEKAGDVVIGDNKDEKSAEEAAKAAENKEDADGFVIEKAKGSEEPTELTSWADLGKVLDFEVKDDSEEGLKTSFNEFLKTKVSEAVEAAKATTLEKELAAIDPEAQMLFDFVKTGGKVEEFTAPLKPYERLEAMDNETLIREAEKLAKTPEADIDAKIVELTDAGKIDEEAKGIREYVKAEKIKFQQEIVKKRQETFQKTYKAENDSIKTALDKVENIFDIPLKKEVRQTLAEKIPNYRERFKNEPELVARAIALLELGDQAKGLIHKKGYEEATSKLTGKIFNLEDVPHKASGAASSKDTGGGETLAEQYEAQLRKEEQAAR